AARRQQPPRAALRGREVDARGRRRAARAPVLQLLDQPPGFLDPSLGLGGARLGAAAEPLDLAPDGVGQGVLVGGLTLEERVAAREELAVGAVRLEETVRID